ncbi:hypothetical protein RFI_24134 [Reticulomyxa filosa]|uniref:Uncharacterized protein n=1 Tax=Reticulomyxa filosa TaxID=46433 RepID=X6MJK8_RETFI|nr:hypothetical protein RFI_24134 [Reticulomyxa filosa]|eukprot:ETO13245.1 hypothetical protein RFI_24134 [Reticulomyxa filosa]
MCGFCLKINPFVLPLLICSFKKITQIHFYCSLLLFSSLGKKLTVLIVSLVQAFSAWQFVQKKFSFFFRHQKIGSLLCDCIDNLLGNFFAFPFFGSIMAVQEILPLRNADNFKFSQSLYQLTAKNDFKFDKLPPKKIKIKIQNTKYSCANIQSGIVLHAMLLVVIENKNQINKQQKTPNLMILLEWNIDEANYKLGRRKDNATEEDEEDGDGEYDDVVKQVLWKPKLSFPTLLESFEIFANH